MKTQPKQKQSRNPKQNPAGSADGQTQAPTPARTRDARGRWTSRAETPRAAGLNPAPEGTPPPAATGRPAPANPPGVSTSAPKSKRPSAPRRAPEPTFNIAGVGYRRTLDDNPWSDDSGDVRQSASGQWYLLAGGSMNDDPTPEDIYPLTPAGIVERLVRSNFDVRFWRDFAPYLPTLYPAAAASAPILPADPARLLPPEHRNAFRALLPRLVESDAPAFLGFLAGELLGLAAVDPVLARELPARFNVRVRAGTYGDGTVPDNAPPVDSAASSLAPWRFTVTLLPVLDGLFRAMLADEGQTAEEWAREWMLYSVKSWVQPPDFAGTLESLAAA